MATKKATNKLFLVVTMPDNSMWAVPAKVIAHSRASYYAKLDTGKTGGPEYCKVYDEEFALTLKDQYELFDWAENNMDWADVEQSAFRVGKKSEEVDYQAGWIEGEKTLSSLEGEIVSLDGIKPLL